jgi:hypothetical protein
LEKATLKRYNTKSSDESAEIDDPFCELGTQSKSMRCLNAIKLSFGGRVNSGHSRSDIRNTLNAFLVSYTGMTAKIFSTDKGCIKSRFNYVFFTRK